MAGEMEEKVRILPFIFSHSIWYNCFYDTFIKRSSAEKSRRHGTFIPFPSPSFTAFPRTITLQDCDVSTNAAVLNDQDILAEVVGCVAESDDDGDESSDEPVAKFTKRLKSWKSLPCFYVLERI